MDVFDLYAKISLDTSGYEKNLSGAKSLFMSAGKSISASTIAMGTMIAHGLEKAASTIIDLGKSAITASAEVRAETAQFEAAFGELQAAAEGAFSGIEKDTGVLSTRLRTVGTKAFSQFKGAGLDAASALSEMDRYTRLAADAAAYYDMSIEDADERLRSFLRGNTEAGDMIGLFTSETQRNNKALETYGAKWLDLTEAQKQMLMLDIADEIYQQSGAIGQASREADGWENVTGNLKESWRQLLAVVGEPFQTGLTPVLQKMSEFFGDETIQMRVGMFAANVGKVAGLAFDGVVSFLDKLIGLSEGTETSDTFESIKGLLDNLIRFAGVAFDSVTGFLGMLIGGESTTDTIDSIASFLEDVSSFLANNAEVAMALIGSVTALHLIQNPFSMFIAALALIATNWSDIKEFATAAVDKINSFLDTVVPDGFMQGVVDVLSTISGLIGGIAGAWQSFIDSLSSGVAQQGISSVQQSMNQGGIGSAIGTAFGEAWWNPFKSSGTSYGTGAGRSFATGLDYVPYNDYLARLHEGEAVLTKSEATAWRRNGMQTGAQGGGMSTTDAQTIGAIIASAVVGALNGMDVRFGDDVVGRVFAPQVSRELKNLGWRERYA